MFRKELLEGFRNRGLGKRYHRNEEVSRTRNPLRWIVRLLFPERKMLNKTQKNARRLRQLERNQRKAAA